MEFIRVTLVEEWNKKGSPSKVKRIKDHLLPVAGILSIAPNFKNPESSIIYIVEHFKPKEDFIIGYAEAEIPSNFIKIINEY